jgi:hypothetical protein
MITVSPWHFILAVLAGWVHREQLGDQLAVPAKDRVRRDDGIQLAQGAIGEANASQGVGGNQDDDLAPRSGAVYVFRRSGTVWQQEAYLKASNTGGGDYFGTSVAFSGDTLAVGARYEDSGATGTGGDQTSESTRDSGAIYIFH